MSDKDKTNNRSDNNERLISLVALMADNETPLGPKPGLHEIQNWHLGKLDTDRAAQVKSHVARDPECYQMWSELLAEEKTTTPDNVTSKHQSALSVISKQIKHAWNKLGQIWLAGGLVTAMVAMFAIILIPQQGAWSPIDDPIHAELAYDWPYANISVTRGGELNYRTKIALQAGIRVGIEITTLTKQGWEQATYQLPEKALDCDQEPNVNTCVEHTETLKKLGTYAGVLYLACLDYTQGQQSYFDEQYWKNMTAAWHSIRHKTKPLNLDPLQSKIKMIGTSNSKQQQCDLVRDVIFMSY